MNECEFQEICPTTNFWIEEKKQFIEAVCKTSDCLACVLRSDFKDVEKASKEWKRMVEFYANRRKQFPPYGVIKP